MRISVIIPCHNASAWIGETLRSVAAQVTLPHEVIVIDDSSTDDSCDVAQNSGVDVRLLKSTHRNAAAARNIGIREATGDWIAFLDADDIWYPHHLEEARNQLAGSADQAYIANHHILKSNGSVEPLSESLQPKIQASQSGMSHLEFPKLMARGFHFGHSTVLLRRDRVLEVGLFDEKQTRRHDLDLWLRVISGGTWAWGGRAAAQYRVDTPGSISKNVVNAEYFFLRALLKNQDDFPVPAMRQVVEIAAQRSVSLGFVDGDWEDYRRARQIAWPYLRLPYQMCYLAAEIFPPALRWAIRLKRRVMVRQVVT